MDPDKQQLKGRMSITKNDDGSEEYRYMSLGGWRKCQASGPAGRSNWREATRDEVVAWEINAGIRNVEPDIKPASIENKEPEEVLEEAPIEIERSKEEVPADILEAFGGSDIDKALERIRTKNDMEIYFITELDFEDMDRDKTLDELKKLARDMHKDKE